MKKNSIKVSIIVPVYNGELFISKCLDSLLNQTLKDIEIIVINDGSSDNSDNIILEYKKKYNNIKYKKIKNSGVSTARNIGLDIARGEYILFCDCDDYLDLDACEKLYEKAVSSKSDCVVCGYYSEDENGKFIKMALGNINEYSVSLENNPDIIYYSNSFIASKLISKKLLIKYDIKFNPKYRIFEDLLFVYMVMLKANKIEKIDKCYYHYIRRKNTSITGKFNEKFFDLFPVIDELKEYYLKNTKVDFQNQLTFLAIKHSFLRFVSFNKFSLMKKKIEFINKTYDYLDDFDKNWKRNKYFEIKKINYSIFRNKVFWFFSPIMYSTLDFFKKVKSIIFCK